MAVTQMQTTVSNRIPMSYVVAMVPVAAALNIIGGVINSALHLPTFLDMIGTGVVAMTLGPWWGALTGVITNVGSAVIRNPVSLPFVACNVVGALIWGYGIRAGLGKSFVRFFLLSILVALGVTITAVPIYVFVFGGATGHFGDMMTAAFLAMGQNLFVSVFSSNIIVSLADKIFSSFIALAILEALPRTMQMQGEIIRAEKMQRVYAIAGGLVLGVAAILVAIFMQGGN